MKYEEALLRIDALGWTYVEETRFKDALSEINKGLAILSTLPRSKEIDDLEALAMAWQGRINLEQGNLEEASNFLEKANGIPVNPWIQTRIKMAQGDIAMESDDYEKAIECYLFAEKLTDPEYGGYGLEGHNYQINPRLGFAYLESKNLEKARKKFEALEMDDYIAIGRLYAKYGLARIDYEKGTEINDREMQRQAIVTIYSIDKELKSRTTSNLLQVMINRFLIPVLKDFDVSTISQHQKI